MIYIKLNPEITRLGNWLFSYAGAVSSYPDEQITLVLQKSRWVDDPRKYSSLWPTVKYEICGATDCTQCGKCLKRTNWGARGLDVVQVRRALRCPDDTRRQITERFGPVLEKGATSISVRRGDYLKLPHTNPFIGAKYLKQALAKFANEHHFIVCSDDIPWCRRFFTSRRFPGKTFYFSEGGDVLFDFFLPTFCEHNIISNSTFNWWGAFLNQHPNRRVIAPSMWLGIASKNRKSYLDQFRIQRMEIIPTRYSFVLLIEALFFWGAYSCVAFLRSVKKRPKTNEGRSSIL